MINDLLIGLGAFAATNIDGFVVLTLLFTRSNGEKTWQIVAGTYVGSFLLLFVSLLVSRILANVPSYWVGVIGLVVLTYGIHGLRSVTIAEARMARPKARSHSFWSAIGLTLADGGDNVSVYIPLMHQMAFAESMAVVLEYVVLIGILCLISRKLAYHMSQVAALQRIARPAVPIALIVVGTVILIGSGAAANLASHLIAC
jgi:cadmium resistance protein CadD (predicted permease)